jgi:hypothetical protein
MALDGAVIFDGEISPAFPVEHAGGVEAADGGDVSVTRAHNSTKTQTILFTIDDVILEAVAAHDTVLMQQTEAAGDDDGIGVVPRALPAVSRPNTADPVRHTARAQRVSERVM